MIRCNDLSSGDMTKNEFRLISVDGGGSKYSKNHYPRGVQV